MKYFIYVFAVTVFTLFSTTGLWTRPRLCYVTQVHSLLLTAGGSRLKAPTPGHVYPPPPSSQPALIHSSPPMLSPALTELLNCHSLLIYIPPPAHFDLWLSLKLYSVLKSISLIFNSSLFIRVHKSRSRRTSSCLTATITNLKVSPFCFFD